MIGCEEVSSRSNRDNFRLRLRFAPSVPLRGAEEEKEESRSEGSTPNFTDHLPDRRMWVLFPPSCRSVAEAAVFVAERIFPNFCDRIPVLFFLHGYVVPGCEMLREFFTQQDIVEVRLTTKRQPRLLSSPPSPADGSRRLLLGSESNPRESLKRNRVSAGERFEFSSVTELNYSKKKSEVSNHAVTSPLNITIKPSKISLLSEGGAHTSDSRGTSVQLPAISSFSEPIEGPLASGRTADTQPESLSTNPSMGFKSVGNPIDATAPKDSGRVSAVPPPAKSHVRFYENEHQPPEPQCPQHEDKNAPPDNLLHEHSSISIVVGSPNIEPAWIKKRIQQPAKTKPEKLNEMHQPNRDTSLTSTGSSPLSQVLSNTLERRLANNDLIVSPTTPKKLSGLPESDASAFDEEEFGLQLNSRPIRKRPYSVIASMHFEREIGADQSLSGIQINQQSSASAADGLVNQLDQFPLLPKEAFPKVGDVLAFRTMSLCTDTWEPVLSSYTKAAVIAIKFDEVEAGKRHKNRQLKSSDVLRMKVWRSGDENNKCHTTKASRIVDVQWGEMIDVRVVKGPSSHRLLKSPQDGGGVERTSPLLNHRDVYGNPAELFSDVLKNKRQELGLL